MAGIDKRKTLRDQGAMAVRKVGGGGGQNAFDNRIIDAFLPPPPGVKVPVTEDNAITLSAVWACIRVISSGIAILPMEIIERSPGVNEAVTTDAITPVALARKPCPEIGSVSFWETMVSHALLRGNGYAEIERDSLGNPIAMWPLLPNQVRPWRDPADHQLKYEAWGFGYWTVLPAHNVFHLAGLGYDGIMGYSPTRLAARSMGLTAAAEQAGDAYFSGGMKPGGWVEYPNSLQDMQKANLKDGIKAEHAGATAFGKALLLYGGAKFHPIDISPDDAQFLETRQFQVEDVCRWFNVPPHKVQHLLRATFSNIEHQSQEFVTGTLLYWLTKIANEFDSKLLSRFGPHYFSRHSLKALLRGDTITRYTAYGMGRQWGFLSVNDIRREENMAPVEGGDVYHVPVNMAPAGTNGAPAKP